MLRTSQTGPEKVGGHNSNHTITFPNRMASSRVDLVGDGEGGMLERVA
jgi:hypothetical protein